MRVLVLVEGRMTDRLSGPEIRGLEIARALAGRHEVTAAVRGAPAGNRDGFAVVPYTRRSVLRQALANDVIVGPCVPPFLFAVKALRTVVIVTDQYDPVDLELGTAGLDREAAAALAAQRLQLRFADLILCAGRRQRARIECELATLPGPRPLADVPFGLPAPPPPARGRPLRERFPQLRESDRIVLWWGSIWPWLDAETPLRALALLARERDDVKLVFAAGKRADAAADRHSAAEGARALAGDLGLLDRHAFFIDDWIPYEERHEYLAEADVGLVLHRDTPEATVAARARYMDYLWTGLPCVLARGDEVADRFARAGFATLVEPGDAEAVRAALSVLLDRPGALDAARAAAPAVAREYEWGTLVQPLTDAIDDGGSRARLSAKELGALVGAGAAYYARRAGDAVVRYSP